MLAAYLTWVHFDMGSLVCGLGDCHTVQASEFATVGTVPVSLLGLVMYLSVLACSLMMRWRPAMAFAATTAAFAVALAGAVYAVYLTWIEVAVIDAICQWCVVSALLTVALTAVEGAALWRTFAAPTGEQIETGRETATY